MRRIDNSRHPVSDEIAATLGAFVSGGDGPRHTVLTRVFDQTGYGRAAPYDAKSPSQQLNKEDRVRLTVQEAVRDPARSRDLIEGLLSEYRAFGFFTQDEDPAREKERLKKCQFAQHAFIRISWELTSSGEIRPAGVASVVSIEGRPAIEEQLERLRRSSDDSALMLGTAKEMLESTAKYVCESFSVPYDNIRSFDALWHHARERIGLLPQQVMNINEPGAEELRTILQSSWTIASMANKLRNDEGTGHGRTLPTAISPGVAHLVVREACSIVQLVLETLDIQMGR